MSCSEKVETHPADTVADADESAMNFRGSQLPREPPKRCNLSRIHLLGTSVNKAKRRAGVLKYGTPASLPTPSLEERGPYLAL
jgi:hypothetical protein